MKKLKRLLIVLAAMVIATAAIFGCGKTPDKGGANPIAVYMPDGAPALSPSAIEGSNIYVQSVKDAEVKTLVKDYIDDMIKIQKTAAKAITDDFFIA